MHGILVLWVIIAVILWGDWRHWERYYPTMLYMALMGLLYQFIRLNFFSLWIIEQDFIFNRSIAELLHALVINPLSAFLFLSNYPQDNNKTKIGLHYLKWFLIFLIVESIGHHFGFITYHNGWTLGWSAFFIIVMFPMLRLHYRMKLLALPLSVFWVLFYLVVMGYF